MRTHDAARHSRRPDQCRPRRHARGASSGLRRGRLAARPTPITLKTQHRDRPQRRPRPARSRRAGQHAALRGPAPGSRLREAGRDQRRPAPSRPLLADRAGRRRRPAALARVGELRPRRRPQPRHRPDHPPYRPRSRRRARSRHRAISTTAGGCRSTYEIAGIGATEDGRNGGGDPYFTDGKALVGVLASQAAAAAMRRIAAAPRCFSTLRLAMLLSRCMVYVEIAIVVVLICVNGLLAMSELADRFVPPGPPQGDDRPRTSRAPAARWRSAPIPAASCRPCRSASRWSACCPAPSPAPRSASGWRELLVDTACPTGMADAARRRHRRCAHHLRLADHRRAGAQADRAARSRRRSRSGSRRP